ncbi:MAG: hypothetical protein A3G75_09845 [Verrucomicrobia bacterium RIFCSPLOWO2_12_FULL_64_8]|nr:MAG: hypothetical protein A3G75_09845 [Verrucomicrobia bacterium RIFCSPLOWO2_12_FULL_64_8]
MNRAAPSAFINQLLVYTLVMLGFAGSVGFATVWLRHEISLAANRNKNLQVRLVEVERQLDRIAAEIAAEQNPEALIRRNSEWRLGLVSPRREQVEYVEGDLRERRFGPGGRDFRGAELRPVILLRNSGEIH